MERPKTDSERIREAAIDITSALAVTIRQLSSQLKKKHGIRSKALNRAIAKAAINTAAMSAMASIDAPLGDSLRLAEQLERVVNKTLKPKETP